MNVLKGIIESVKVKSSLSLVHIMVGETLLSSIIIDTPETAPYLKSGNPVNVIFKETEVIVGKGTHHDVSLQNRLAGTVFSIESGDLLSKIIIDTDAGKITSVITSNAVNQLELKKGSEVTAMIKTNEIMLAE